MSAKVKTSAFLVQGCATMIISFLTSLTGFVFAWPSYSFEKFLSNDTYLDEPITINQMAMLGSITNLGGLIATPISFYLLDKIGRKYSAMLFGLPFVISWALISITTSFYVVLLAVAMAGFSAAGQSISSIYISEIAEDSIRGLLTSSVNYGYLIGLLSSYIFGGYMSYYNVLYLHLALSILYIVMLIPLKESPCFLLKKGKEKEAQKSIAFYRRLDIDSKEVETEIRNIRKQFNLNIDIIPKTGDKYVAPDPLTDSQETLEFLKKGELEPVKQKLSAWQFLKQSESSKNALTTVIISISVMILMGSLVLQVFAESLFKEAIPTMHSNTCSILIALDYLIASVLGALSLDKFGRKTLMTITSFLAGIFTIAIGTQLHLHWAPHWFTAAIIYTLSFTINFGAAHVPFVLAAEVFLPEVRALGNSIILAVLWIMNWVLTATFFPLVELIGLGQTFYIFAAMCFIGAIYSHFFIPETKGLSADAIQLLFMKNGRNSIQV